MNWVISMLDIPVATTAEQGVIPVIRAESSNTNHYSYRTVGSLPWTSAEREKVISCCKITRIEMQTDQLPSTWTDVKDVDAVINSLINNSETSQHLGSQ